MQAYILAGGFGTRLRDVVSDVPKPMALIAGRPFLECQLQYLYIQGITEVVMCVGYRYQPIIDHFGRHYGGIDIEYSLEKTPLGTGGALCQALRKFKPNDVVLCINGDSLFPVGLQGMKVFHQKTQATLTMSVLKMSPNTRYGGVVTNENNRVIGFNEKHETVNGGLVNTGVYLVNPEIVNFCDRFTAENISLEREIFPILVNQRTCYAYAEQRPFIDIGVPEDYKRAQHLIPQIIQQIEAERLCH